MEKALYGSTTIFQLMGLQFFSLKTNFPQHKYPFNKQEFTKNHKFLLGFNILLIFSLVEFCLTFC